MGNFICITNIHFSTTCFFFAFKSAVNPRKYVDTLYYRLSQFYNYCKYNFVFKFDTFPINALALTCMFLIFCCSPWR